MNEPILDVATVPLPITVAAPENPGVMIRHATDVAGVCREIVMRTACNIQGRKYVKYEGWMAIATAHGCIASSRDVRKVEGGWVAIGEIRRMSDGVLLAQAEGFVGLDEKKWGNCPEYASRAMAQTRAISRVCRAAFAHVVVLIDAKLSTTPAEEVPNGGFQDEPPKTPQDAPRTPPSRPAAKSPPTPPKATQSAAKAVPEAKFDTAVFLANCRNKLLTLIGPDIEWAWWKYAQDKSWILSNEHLANATADKMFEGYDPKDIRGSVAALFDAHCTAVNEMAANCPPQWRDEVIRGLVPMPRLGAGNLRPAPKPASPSPKTGNSCPSCNSTATRKHDDLVGVRWCQKCGVQWQEADPEKAYEEHEWMFATLPFAPKDKEKPYKGMTLGQIARLDSKYFYGIAMNFKAEPFKGRPPSAESVAFGEACEAARKHLEKENTGERKAFYPGQDDRPQDDDVPY